LIATEPFANVKTVLVADVAIPTTVADESIKFTVSLV